MLQLFQQEWLLALDNVCVLGADSHEGRRRLAPSVGGVPKSGTPPAKKAKNDGGVPVLGTPPALYRVELLDPGDIKGLVEGGVRDAHYEGGALALDFAVHFGAEGEAVPYGELAGVAVLGGHLAVGGYSPGVVAFLICAAPDVAGDAQDLFRAGL